MKRVILALLLLTAGAFGQSVVIGSTNSTGTISGTYANEGSTGTGLNLLAKKSTANPVTLLKTAITDIRGAFGICVAFCGTSSPSPTIQTSGDVPCVFENAVVAGDFVILGNTTAGNCRDAGTTKPTNGGQIVGVVNATGSAGTYTISLYALEDISVSPAVVTSAYTNATTTFSTVTNMSWAIAASTNYKLDCQLTWQGSATTTGPKFQLTGPGSPTAVNLNLISAVTATTELMASAVAFSSAVANTGTITATTNFPAHVNAGIVNGANAGTLALQAAANGAGTLTIQPGSSCQLVAQ